MAEIILENTPDHSQDHRDRNAVLKTMAGFGIVLTFIVVAAGAYTRLADAGLGCPDWPGCYGYLTVPQTENEIALAEALYPSTPVESYKAWWEMGHRYVAGSLLLLVFAMFILAFRGRKEHTPIGLLSALLLVISCQAAFGAWTVTLKLWPQVVTAHLLGGFTTLSLMWLIFVRQGGAKQLTTGLQAPGALRRIALIVVVLQIALGGWVSSNYAALACWNFPACDASYVPSLQFSQGFNLLQDVGPNYLGGLMESDARKTIHWVHRLGALVVVIAFVPLIIQLFKENRTLAVTTGFVLATQIGLGILNVVWALPLINATLHNVVGALLLLTVVTVNFAPSLHRNA